MSFAFLWPVNFGTTAKFWKENGFDSVSSIQRNEEMRLKRMRDSAFG